MRHTDSKCAFLSIGRAAALSVSLFALAGCVSATAENDTTDSRESQQSLASSEASASGNQADIRDDQAAVPGTAVPGTAVPGTQESSPMRTAGAQAQSSGETTALQQGLTMQSTALRAASSSIYGQSPATAAVPGANGGTPVTTGAQPAMNATTNSLFSGQPVAPPVILPQEGASSEASTETPAVAQNAVWVPAAEEGVPSAVPLPLSAQAARAGETSRSLETVEVASADQVPEPGTGAVQGADSDENKGGAEGTTATAGTLASLFAPKRKVKLRNDGPGDARQPLVASLAYNALPGVNRNPLFSWDHADHVSDAESAAPVEVANLSGLARLAPNGLVLQTEKVETGCFKPALLGMLKTVERHYGQKVMITSGLRPIKVNRERQSLHTRCEAADIQVKGVSKWDLADYLRSLPGRGGVGTYCHTESVHIDIGPQRDWNWRCRRRTS